MRRALLEDLASILGAYAAVWLVRHIHLEREVRAGLKDLESL